MADPGERVARELTFVVYGDMTYFMFPFRLVVFKVLVLLLLVGLGVLALATRRCLLLFFRCMSSL